MVGCSGRSLFTKCQTCNNYHKDGCPSQSDFLNYSKWKHSFNFKSQDTLYNFWFAKEFIKKTRTAVIVESPGNVWRLEEAGIHNSVAIFGTNLSNHQRMLLDSSGAMNLVIATDNDEPGNKAAEMIASKCNKIYNTYRLKIDYPDIGEMSVDQVKDTILPQISKYNL
jgi:DNA primase